MCLLVKVEYKRTYKDNEYVSVENIIAETTSEAISKVRAKKPDAYSYNIKDSFNIDSNRLNYTAENAVRSYLVGEECEDLVVKIYSFDEQQFYNYLCGVFETEGEFFEYRATVEKSGVVTGCTGCSKWSALLPDHIDQYYDSFD